MQKFNQVAQGALLAVALVVGAGRAEMVFDDETSSDTQVRARDDLRKTYKVSQDMETAQVVADAAVTTEPVVVESERLTRSELLRRKRIRAEMNNEDLLSQRLEELRLREEEKRTKKILKTAGLSDDDSTAPVISREMSPAPVIVETAVQAPITEKAPEAAMSQQMTAAPVISAQTVQPIQSADRMALSQSAAVSGASMMSGETSKAGRISVSPKLGLASITNDFFEFRSRYAAGLSLAAAVSDYLSLDLSYTFAQNSIWMRFYNPYQELNFNQNLFDATMKLHFTGPDAVIRPYLAGGAGYSMGYINFDQRTQTQLNAFNVVSQDYQINQIFGAVGGGLEIRVGGNATIGAGYKLLVPVSTTSERPLYNWAFFQNPNQMLQDNVRGSLRDSRTQLFLVNATFSF